MPMSSSAPPPLPSRGSRPPSKSLPDINDFESKYRFHGIRDIPPPEPYIGSRKTYPSSLTATQQTHNPWNRGTFRRPSVPAISVPPGMVRM